MSKDDKPTKLEPRLRFPEFKGGPGWDTPAMSDVYGFCSTNSLSRDQLNYDNGSIYNIHYGDIHTKFQTQFRLDSERVPFIDPAAAEELGDRFHLCREGDIILADASEDLNDVGKAIELISLGDRRVVAGTHTIHATRLGDNPVVGFGGYLFKSAAVRRGIHKEAQGAKVYGISSTRIGAIRLPLPHTEAEQRKIAECLGSLDDWIAAETDALAALRRYKTGMMQQLFPRPGETRPRLRFPEFRDAGHWRFKPLGKLLDGKPSYGVNAAAVPFSEDLPTYVRITDIDDDGRLVGTDRVSVDIEASSDDYLRDGDIVLARTGASVGKSYRYRTEDGRLVYAGFLIRIRPNPKLLNSIFLASYLFTGDFWDWVRLTSARSGQPGINGAEYACLPIPIPPPTEGEPAEQRRIANCLASLDDLIAAKAEKLATLRDHKRGLMQQLFPAPDLQPGEAP
jgi:type I restriction enzyme S subunit